MEMMECRGGALLNEDNLSVDIAEGLAVMRGVKLARSRGVRHIIVEMDSQVAFYALSQLKEDVTYFGRIMADIREEFVVFDRVKLSWVR